MATTKGVPAKKDANLPVSADGFFQDDYTGFENVTSDMLKIPFLKIAQDMSPQTKKRNSEYIEGLEPGMFFNNVTEEIYGEKVDAVILGVLRKYIEWGPDRGGLVRQYSVEEFEAIRETCSFDKSAAGHVTAEGNVIRESRNFFIFLPDFPDEGIMILSFMSTALEDASKWIMKASTRKDPKGRKLPIFGGLWELAVGEKGNDKGSWYGIGKIDLSGYAWDSDVVEAILQAKDIVKELAQQAIDFSGASDHSAKDTDL
jgi:hypothetical protein